DSVNILLKQIKFVSDYMSKIGKHLVIILAPGKAAYYPEYIPHKYKKVNDSTNYKYISSGLKNEGLNIIDFHKWFIENKTKSKYPLYPQFGTHWSNYGSVLAADSIIKKIEILKKIDMPNLIYNQIYLKQPIYIDYDIAEGMNLLFRFKSFDMAYPRISTERLKKKKRPNVLVVSDSFYWGMYDFGISKSFNNHHFWYYNKQVYPDSHNAEVLVDNSKLADEINNHDVFMVIVTDANLPKMGWGFFENLENLFKTGWLPTGEGVKEISELEETRQNIRMDNNWMKQIEGKAKERKITVDSMLTLDAIWTLEHQN
ncbi:MAG: hypothetical protein WCH21_09060, partial [Bacteroidota bacterium]